MDASGITLQALINAPKQYIIPVFQRYYSWRMENWEVLWHDLANLLKPHNKTRTHFMGSLVFFPIATSFTGNQAYQVIDGQQRLVTFSIILAALRYVAHEYKQEQLEAEVYRYFLVHEFKKGAEHFRIYPRQRDANEFLQTITNPSRDIEGGIGNAFRYFSEKIANVVESSPSEQLQAIFDMLKTQIEFVYIQLGNENPYEIFKSLNSTGIPLSEADLIRNFVFMHVAAEHQNDFDDQYWRPLEAHFENEFGERAGELNASLATSFFRDFLMQSGDYVRSDDVFATFEKKWGKQFDPIDLVKQLEANARYYDIILGTKQHASPKINASLKKLRKLDTSTTYPLLMALLNCEEQGRLDEEQLVQAIELLAGFVLRRYATNQSSRAYGRWFVAACRELGNAPLTNLHDYLKGRGFPDDQQFQTAFITFPWYVRSYAPVILEALEQTTQHKEPVDLSKTSVEHIMPQTLTIEWRQSLGNEAEQLHEEWLHTIGNLTLSAYNSELYNHPFAVKRQEYKKSNITLNRQLSEMSQWGIDEIKERGRILAEIASRIWIGPSESSPNKVSDQVIPENGETSRELTALRRLQLDYWTTFKQYLDAQGDLIKSRKPFPQHWMDLAIGRADFNLIAYINNREKRIGVSLGIYGSNAKKHYHLLYQDKAVIETELGIALTWWELPHKKSSYIDYHTFDFDIWDRTQWVHQHAWIYERLLDFYNCFTPRIKGF